MSDVVIRVEGLSKLYHIGALQARYETLRESLSSAVAAPFRRLTNRLNHQRRPEEERLLWALRDVTFDVTRGEAVGIIGPNGAGKSTLLKILSRITEPTEGRAEIVGRIGTLLEVGTGFHPELTGRENIYLNGAILGMKKSEIDSKFDEIVAFSEIEKFIDTPVKHYSSGMHVRLAFSVAAHLEPEILLVDEVLAVGDVAFQRKCLGKINDVTQGGRTVLFVSHNMAAIQKLCTRVIMLEGGRVTTVGDTNDIVERYLKEASEGPQLEGLVDLRQMSRSNRITSNDVRFAAMGLIDDKGDFSAQIKFGDDLRFYFEIESEVALKNLSVGFRIETLDGIVVCGLSSQRHGYVYSTASNERLKLRVTLSDLGLRSGFYRIGAIELRSQNFALLDYLDTPTGFEVLPIRIPASTPAGKGLVNPPTRWEQIEYSIT